LRVVAGTFKGHPLRAPRRAGTRPTQDRVREALFSMLGSLEGLDVLDLYAGSGALGIEALSRGAREATFVERDRAAVAAIEANVRATGFADRATIARDEALRFVMKDDNRAAGWDLVLADPPYEHDVGEVEAILGALAEGALAEGWTCVLTRATRNLNIVIPVHWRAYRRLEYGDSAVLIARQEPVEA
jgi:16S rRNA (guanine966-N2)-methyltransferase